MAALKKTYHTSSAILKHDSIFIVSNLLGVNRVLFSIILLAVAEFLSLSPGQTGVDSWYRQVS